MKTDCYPQGGGSSVVVKDGRAYYFYYKSQYNESSKSWSEIADEYLLCLDAKTGETLWKEKLGTGIDAGRGGRYSKGLIYNHTPAVALDKVFVCGSTGRLYCRDAETGAPVWTSQASPIPMTSGLIVADSTLAMGIGGGRAADDASVAGFDIETGDRKWLIEHSLGGNATPSLWVHNGKEYIITAHILNGTRCIDPSSGDELWRIENAGNNYSIPVSNDYMVVNSGTTINDDGESEVTGRSEGILTAYEITPQGAQERWARPGDFFLRNAAAIIDDRLYTVMSENFLIIDLPTGNTIDSVRMKWGSQQVQVLDNIMLAEDDCCHGSDETFVLNADPDNFGSVIPATWVPTTMQTSSYVTPIVHAYADGRLFVRGYDAIYCFDMRKQPNAPSAGRAHYKLGAPALNSFAVSPSSNGIMLRITQPAGARARITIYQAASGRIMKRALAVGPGIHHINAGVAPGAYICRVEGLGVQGKQTFVLLP